MDDFKPTIGDEAVRAKTGKDWQAWFHILDDAGAREMNHQQIVAYLHNQHQVGDWWQQMVAVTYEQTRGLRGRHEKPGGYQISRSRTIPAPVERLFAAWQDESQREIWLPGEIGIRKATQNHSLRASWGGERSNLDIRLYPKGAQKTQVTVQHSELPDAEQAEKMKTYWAEALERLEAYLSS
jgi:uncharacterized protein YndB with AHSA1/START domain